MGRRIERTFAWQLPTMADRLSGKEVNINMRGGRVLHGLMTFLSNDCKEILLKDGRGAKHRLLLQDIEVIHRDLPADF